MNTNAHRVVFRKAEVLEKPLVHGSSQVAISHNIKEMKASGHPQAQAVAASLSEARRAQKSEELDKAMALGCDYDVVKKNIDTAVQKGETPAAAVRAALAKAGLKKMPAEGRKVDVVWTRKDVKKTDALSPAPGPELGNASPGGFGP